MSGHRNWEAGTIRKCRRLTVSGVFPVCPPHHTHPSENRRQRGGEKSNLEMARTLANDLLLSLFSFNDPQFPWGGNPGPGRTGQNLCPSPISFHMTLTGGAQVQSHPAHCDSECTKFSCHLDLLLLSSWLHNSFKERQLTGTWVLLSPALSYKIHSSTNTDCNCLVPWRAIC